MTSNAAWLGVAFSLVREDHEEHRIDQSSHGKPRMDAVGTMISEIFELLSVVECARRQTESEDDRKRIRNRQ
jgi:hypothetical protein